MFKLTKLIALVVIFGSTVSISAQLFDSPPVSASAHMDVLFDSPPVVAR